MVVGGFFSEFVFLAQFQFFFLRNIIYLDIFFINVFIMIFFEEWELLKLQVIFFFGEKPFSSFSFIRKESLERSCTSTSFIFWRSNPLNQYQRYTVSFFFFFFLQNNKNLTKLCVCSFPLSSNSNFSGLSSQSSLSLQKCAEMFIECAEKLSKREKTSFDKDDIDALRWMIVWCFMLEKKNIFIFNFIRFVLSASNLRSHVFSIELQTEFQVIFFVF